MTEYYRTLISAESEDDARQILTSLIKSKLVAGGMISNDPSIFRWKGEIIEMKYYNISAFTVSSNVEKIKEEVKKLSKEEVPIIAFFKIYSANEKFLSWIKENTK